MFVVAMKAKRDLKLVIACRLRENDCQLGNLVNRPDTTVCLSDKKSKVKRKTSKRSKTTALVVVVKFNAFREEKKKSRLQSATIKMKMTQQVKTLADEAAVKERAGETGANLVKASENEKKCVEVVRMDGAKRG